MQPSSRIQASIEIIETVLGDDSLPADTIITHYFRNRRYIGSQDRKAIAELTYQILRHKITCEAILKSLNEKHVLAERNLVLMGLIHCQQKSLPEIEALFDGKKYSPPPLTPLEREMVLKATTFSLADLKESDQLNIQEWQLLQLQKSFEENSDIDAVLKSLAQPASLDLRINTLKASVEKVQKRLKQDDISFKEGSYSPIALRLGERRPLGNHPLWVEGDIEVQDEGSQLLAYLVDAKPGQAVWDYCAGAGGKTLAIASFMKNKGRLIASDIHDWRLNRSRERFKRAGVYNVECHHLHESTQKWVKRQYGKFDRVLIDVPCSGSGTWRRNPDLKWRISVEDFEALTHVQQEILEKAAKLVKVGGRLIYSTCSLFKAENLDQVEKFLKNHPEFSLIPIPLVWQEVLKVACPTIDPVLQLRPDLHHTDGFFIAVLEKQEL